MGNAEKEDETAAAAAAAVAEEPEGFMNPRCGGLDRLCRISVFEEDGNAGYTDYRESSAGGAAGLGIK